MALFSTVFRRKWGRFTTCQCIVIKILEDPASHLRVYGTDEPDGNAVHCPEAAATTHKPHYWQNSAFCTPSREAQDLHNVAEHAAEPLSCRCTPCMPRHHRFARSKCLQRMLLAVQQDPKAWRQVKGRR